MLVIVLVLLVLKFMWCSGGVLGVRFRLVVLVRCLDMLLCICLLCGISSVELVLISILGGMWLILCSVVLFMLVCFVVLVGFMVLGMI